MIERRSEKTGWWRARVLSFGYAFRGWKWLLLSQPHAQIHAVATVTVLFAGWWVVLTAAEWVCIVMAIGIVWVAEALNTAIEMLADAVCPEEHPLVGKAKDVAAGAVLIAAVTATVIGVLIFGSRLAAWLNYGVPVA